MRMLYRSALLVVVIGFLTSCSNSASTTPSSTTPTPNANSVVVNVPNTGGYGGGNGASSFVPGDVTIPVGGSVDWSNMDGVEHHPTADDGSWDADLPAGSDADVKFKTAGTWSYHCSIHPSMTGSVTVK
jgi:plastocyanin